MSFDEITSSVSVVADAGLFFMSVAGAMMIRVTKMMTMMKILF